MATQAQLEELFMKADRAGDEETAKMAAMALGQLRSEQSMLTHAIKPDAPDESFMFKEGRKVPTPLQAAAKAFDVSTLGFGPRFTGRDAREMQEGAIAQFEQEHPAVSFGIDVLSSLPTAGLSLLKAERAATRPVMGAVERGVRAGAVGGVQSGLSSIGHSHKDTAQEQASDALTAAALGLTMGGGTSAAGGILSGITSPVAQSASRGLAGNAAARRYALALQRDIPEGMQGSLTDFARARLRELGPEAALADVGESTRRLADTMATLPGRAKGAFEDLIRERQRGRAGRIMGSAERTLGHEGTGFTQTIDALTEARAAQSEPLYAALRYTTVPVDDELASLIQRAGKEALGKSQRLARLAGEDPISLQGIKDSRDVITNAVIPGKQLDFKALDRVKQALYDFESKFGRAGEKQEAAAFGNLRKQLTAKLDELSPKDDAGNSIYAKAREVFAGHSQLKDAVERGREAFSADALELEKELAGMSAGEIDAFRIGALQALRKKTGTEAGQTSLLKYWKEPNTEDALHRIFGNEKSAFTRTLDAEEQLKRLESVGRGSQTAPRQFAVGELDLEPVMDAGQVIASGLNPASFAGWASKQWNRASMPEKTRNQLAALLTQRGGSAEQELNTLDAVLRKMNENRARRAGLAGALGSTATGKMMRSE